MISGLILITIGCVLFILTYFLKTYLGLFVAFSFLSRII